MIDRINTVTTAAAAVGCGITAGVLLAFSVSVMPALRTLPPQTAMTSMQKMNIAIVSPVFMTVFLGSAALAVAAAATTWPVENSPSLLITVGAALFVIGCFVVTIVVNVPLNDSLAGADASSAAGQQLWSDYLSKWTLWNHLRTVAATLAAVLFVIASMN